MNGRLTRGALALPFGVLLVACGQGSPGGPTPGASPSNTPAGPVHAVGVELFYDEDGNGRRDRGEDVHLPGVRVEVAGRTAVTDDSGRAMVPDVPGGAQQALVEADALPAFFRPPPALPVQVPIGGDAQLGVTLPIGANRRNVYMAVGDSITVGDGSSDGRGYVAQLGTRLDRHLGRALTVNRGVTATNTVEGLRLIRDQLRAERPAYTLIQYGTNDWLHCGGEVPCYTIDNLRRMLQAVKGARSLPCLATIIPANPDLNPGGRNAWVGRMDEAIRELAAEEGALLVDLEAAFRREPDLAALFHDHVHPNDRGHRLMADVFFRALTQPRN
jgi:lysophospholipase L1-like esterase